MDKLNEQLGQLVDSAENFLALAENTFMTSSMKAEALRSGLAEFRDKLKQIYFDNGGENVWE